MTDKALIQPAGDRQMDDVQAALPGGVRVEHQRDDGVLLTGSTRALEELTDGPDRVKLLRDTNLIRLNGNVIDIEADDVLDGVSTRRRVPSRDAKTWVHHIAQLDGPPTTAWIAAVQDAGVEVVEPLGAYGLFLCGDPEAADRVAALDFVA